MVTSTSFPVEVLTIFAFELSGRLEWAIENPSSFIS
jgi:hypothetical protein